MGILDWMRSNEAMRLFRGYSLPHHLTKTLKRVLSGAVAELAGGNGLDQRSELPDPMIVGIAVSFLISSTLACNSAKRASIDWRASRGTDKEVLVSKAVRRSE